MRNREGDVSKVYLGDSVYADVEDGMIKLTTENGLGPTNTIYLDAEVYLALVDYVSARIKAKGQRT
jgi:hypothetical protein